MTTLILQTAALLLCAYFLGAWVACLIRRTFFAAGDEVPALHGATPVTRTASIPASTIQVSPPVRRPDPKPIAIETIERSVPHAAADAASRFEKVLTTAPKSAAAPAATAVAVPVAKVAPVEMTAPAPTPAAPVVNRTAPAPAAPPVTVAPVVPAPMAKPAAPVVTGHAAAIAQAAAASLMPSIAAAAAPVAKAAVPAPAAIPAAPRLDLPAASSGAGPSAVSAPLAPAPATPPTAAAVAAEDLTRIRAIDPALQQRLMKLGVARYRDIAGWLPADVERVSQTLGFNGRIEQENWIEQAQILARGGDTAYARRKDSGQIATASPTLSEGQPKPVATVAVAAPTVAAASSPATATPATPVAPVTVAPAAAQTPPQVEQRAAFAQQPKPAAPAQPVTAATVAVPPSKPAASAPVSHPAVAVPGIAAAAAAAAAAGLGNATGLGRDNLQRIKGINVEVERLLNVQGFSRYNQLAAWTPADASRIDRLLGHEGRVAREGWIEQAGALARGGDAAVTKQSDQPAAPVDAPRPSRLADAIRDTAVRAGPEASVAPTVVAAPRGNDMSGLRSVRSEAYAPAGGARSGGNDDLKRIRGVGVLIEKKLNSMGVTSYAQVANWSSAEIDRVSQVLDFKGRIERENWVEQARILSAGGQTEFSRRVDRGEVETSRNS